MCVCVCVCVCNSSMWDDTYHSAGNQRYMSRVEVMRVELIEHLIYLLAYFVSPLPHILYMQIFLLHVYTYFRLGICSINLRFFELTSALVCTRYSQTER